MKCFGLVSVQIVVGVDTGQYFLPVERAAPSMPTYTASITPGRWCCARAPWADWLLARQPAAHTHAHTHILRHQIGCHISS